MYYVFYKDHSSVYLQCAAANGPTYSSGADVRLRVLAETRAKIRQRAGRYSGSELHAILGCEYLLYLLRLNDMYSIELSFHSSISYLTTFH